MQAALGLFGMIGGPILGLFLLGIIFPWTNYKVSVISLVHTGFLATVGIHRISQFEIAKKNSRHNKNFTKSSVAGFPWRHSGVRAAG